MRPAARRALLVGGSGLVGRALLAQLLAHPGYAEVHALLRRPVPGWPQHAKLHTQQVDFRALPALPPLDDAYIALGTTIRQAGSQAAFRAVDFDAVRASALAAGQAGAKRLMLVSALGADPASRVFYNRVKGEAEQALVELGFETLRIARPALLSGDRAALGQPSRRGEAAALHLLRPLLGLLPKGLRPVAARDVAAALVQAAWSGGPGLQRLDSATLQGAATRAAA